MDPDVTEEYYNKHVYFSFKCYSDDKMDVSKIYLAFKQKVWSEADQFIRLMGIEDLLTKEILQNIMFLKENEFDDEEMIRFKTIAMMLDSESANIGLLDEDVVIRDLAKCIKEYR